LGEDAARGDLPNLITCELCEPEITVRPGLDEKRVAVWRGYGIFGEDAGSSDLRDLIATLFCEPEITVGSSRDAIGETAWRRHGVLDERHSCQDRLRDEHEQY